MADAHLHRNGSFLLPGMRSSGASQREAREQTTALLTAKMVEMETGERLLIERSMEVLLEDPEKAGSVILTLMNLVAQFATNSGRKPHGMKELVDFLLTQLGVEG